MSSQISKWQQERRQRLNHSYQHQRKSRRLIKIFFYLALLLLVTWATTSYYEQSLNRAKDNQDSSRISFELATAEDFSQVIDQLADAKLVYSPLVLKLYGLLHRDLMLKAGKYVLRRDLTSSQILEILSGQTILEKWLTIPEGWRLTQIAERIEANNLGAKEDFLLRTKNASILSPTILERFPFLKEIPADQGLEGYLFPDSYILPPDPQPTDIIVRALQNLAQKLEPEVNQALQERGISLHSVLTLASIIEKEATEERDKQMIADILWRRLANGVALGADPTVLYALGSWDLPLTSKNLQIDSPYNTRRFAGLPPGPIGTSSLSSIMAAVRPKENDYWYFLAESDSGKIHYARTLEEHKQNKARYLR